MELIQLEYFSAVAESQSFRRAAEALHIAQPALSRQIRKLERELGAELFVRSNHGVSVTAAGTAFLPHAKEILALVSASRSVIAFDNVLQLGLSTGLGERLGAVLRLLAEHYPGLDTRLHRLSQRERAQGVAAGTLHAAFLRGNPIEHFPEFADQLVAEELWHEDLVIVAHHEEANSPGPLPLDHFAEHTLAVTAREFNPATVDAITTACETAGFVPTTSDEFDSLETLIARISSTTGLWSVIYESRAQSIRAERVTFRYPRPRITVPTYLIRRAQSPTGAPNEILDRITTLLRAPSRPSAPERS